MSGVQQAPSAQIRVPLPPDENSSIFGGAIRKIKNVSRSSIDAHANAASLADAMSRRASEKPGRRLQVCQEILDTEENYIQALKAVIELYKKPLEEELRRDTQNIELKLDAGEVNTVFSKIPPIIEVHSHLREQLKSVITDVGGSNALVGRILAYTIPQLPQFYRPYINNYDQAKEIITEAEQTRPAFAAFMKAAERSELSKRNSLTDLLIRPVQRLPSLKLLIQELIKCTDPTHPDMSFLQEAVISVDKVLKLTNESKRSCETHQQFLEICQDIEDIPPDLVSSHREFLQQIEVVVLQAGGSLHKYKGKNLALFLFNDCTLIAKSRHRQMVASIQQQLMNSSVVGTDAFGGGSRVYNGNLSGLSMSNLLFGAGGTLSRQLSLTSLRRQGSGRRNEGERKPYKLVEIYSFAMFRMLHFEINKGVFIVKIRDLRAEEICIFQCTNGCSVDQGIEFFDELAQRIRQNSTRDVHLERITLALLQQQQIIGLPPEEVEIIVKTLGGGRTEPSTPNNTGGEFFPPNDRGSKTPLESGSLNRRRAKPSHENSPSQRMRRAFSTVSLLRLPSFSNLTFRSYLNARFGGGGSVDSDPRVPQSADVIIDESQSSDRRVRHPSKMDDSNRFFQNTMPSPSTKNGRFRSPLLTAICKGKGNGAASGRHQQQVNDQQPVLWDFGADSGPRQQSQKPIINGPSNGVDNGFKYPTTPIAVPEAFIDDDQQ